MAEARLPFNLGVLLLLLLPFFVTRLSAAKPEIISSDQDVEMGSTHLMLCKAHADGIITWRKDGEDIDDDQVVIDPIDETSSKLIIKKARMEDSGIYTCHIDFGNREDKIPYQLYVYKRPEFVDTPTYHEFLEGQDAVLPCTAHGQPQVEVTWPQATLEQFTMLPDNSLKITRISRTHRGTYICKASIKGRPVSRELPISVVVNAPPTAIIEEEKRNVLAGPRTNVSITCLVTGVPTPNISWTSPPLSDASRYKFNSDRSELTIPSVVRSDFGEYTCIATNKIAESWASFMLDVTVRPTVSLSKALMEAEPGSNVSVTCEGSGHPPPRIYWVRKGTNTELTSSSDRARAAGPILMIEKVEPADGGLYTCVGRNDIGNDTMDFSLETWPDTPSLITVAAGPASARISLKAPQLDGGTPITHYILEWRKESEGNWSHTIIQSTEPLVLRNLEPYTSYLVRLAAKNRLGQGEFSSEHPMRTQARREPDSPILNDSEVQVEKNSFSIPISLQDEGSAPVIHYVIRYRPDLEDEVWKDMQLPPNATGIHLAGLQYNTSYHLEVKAVNSMGSSSPAHFSFRVPQATAVPKTTIGKGGVIGIVILIFLVLLFAVDATCCYVNRCGLLLYLAVKLLGEKAPGVKSVEEGDGDLSIVDVKLSGLRAQRGSIPKQQQQQNGAQNGVQTEVTCDKAPLTKFEKAPPASDPASEA